VTRSLPAWFDDAKLGVFLHWGLYSVPAWAPRVPDIQTTLVERGPRYLLANNPYAEWYLNTMAIPGSPTAVHHSDVWGGAPYPRFREPFESASAEADLGALADLCRRAGARYVVLTTKHHEGYCLWPTGVAHPTMGAYHSPRDLVGDLGAEVRAAGMRMGLYYSTGYDWPVNGVLMDRAASALLAVPRTPEYAHYVDTHWRELIDRYRPSILWSDIGAPADLDLESLFAHYRGAVPEGVVNDRWVQGRLPGGRAGEWALRAVLAGVEAAWRFLPRGWKSLKPASHPAGDFTTPEYASPDGIPDRKWEATRGVGHSFGANHNEPPEDIISATELIRMLVDVVARNGNLLIGVGPGPDGVVPAVQAAPLEGLGRWLEVNGEAIYGTRPWSVPAAHTSEGTPVRFTRKGENLWAVVMEMPPGRTFTLRGVAVDPVPAASSFEVVLEATGQRLEHRVEAGELTVTLPRDIEPTAAVALRLPVGAATPSG